MLPTQGSCSRERGCRNKAPSADLIEKLANYRRLKDRNSVGHQQRNTAVRRRRQEPFGKGIGTEPEQLMLQPVVLQQDPDTLAVGTIVEDCEL